MVTLGGSLAGDFFARISLGAVIMGLVALIYKPFARCVSVGISWSDSEESAWKRRAGYVLRYIGAIVFLLVIGMVLLGLLGLLGQYTCTDFLTLILLPFVAMLVLRSIIFGIPLRYVQFRLENTFGEPASVVVLNEESQHEEDEEQGSGISQDEVLPTSPDQHSSSRVKIVEGEEEGTPMLNIGFKKKDNV